jgi:hypothetical protein
MFDKTPEFYNENKGDDANLEIFYWSHFPSATSSIERSDYCLYHMLKCE